MDIVGSEMQIEMEVLNGLKQEMLSTDEEMLLFGGQNVNLK